MYECCKDSKEKNYNNYPPIRGFVYHPKKVYPGQNRDVREILSHLIDCLEDWELEKTDCPMKIKTPDY